MIFIAAIAFASCGSGDTREGYTSTTDTSGLNTNTGGYDTLNDQALSGDRGNPDSTIGATTNAKAPDSNATNPNVR